MNGIGGLNFGGQSNGTGFGFGDNAANESVTAGSGWADIDLFGQS